MVRLAARRDGERSAQAAVAGAAVLFGSTFIVVQGALAGAAPVPFVAVRFLIASALLWPLARRRPATPGLWRAGLAAGFPLLAAYLFQTVGLRYVSSSVSAFTTDLLVVIVPILSALVWRQAPTVWAWVGALVAAAGLFLLTGARVHLGTGEALTLGCAVGFAANVVVLARVAPHHDVYRLTAIQLLVVGLGAVVPAFFLGGYGLGPGALAAAGYTAVAASAMAFGLQTWGQRRLSSSRTAVLLMLEPVTAGVLGAATGTPLGPMAGLGAVVILVGIAISELLPSLAARRRTTVAPMTASAGSPPTSGAVVRETAGRVVLGVARGSWYWPGMVVLVLAYAGVAGGLYWHAWSNLLGGLAAIAVGLGWYGSPLRRWEARRREAAGLPSRCRRAGGEAGG
ncbi:MAG TPA: DMT family transporter [Acidimicrobiales bacterium]|nr:DMT family transporter [Acidimicrobiales bacterium]